MNQPDRVIRVNQVAQMLSVTTATIWNKANPKHRNYCPDFPRPFKVSANVTGWLESEVKAYIEKLAAKRKGAQS